MKFHQLTRLILTAILIMVLGQACVAPQQPTAEPTVDPTLETAIPGGTEGTPTPTPSPIPTQTLTPTVTPTPVVLGPIIFPKDVNPLTGLKLANPDLLNRRPIVVKVENLPRENRPQHGISLADIVFEYYTEEGTTRFAAVYYGQDATRVGPIRSARYFDEEIVRMIKGILVFGFADPRVMYTLQVSEIGKRLIIETLSSCPALCRYEPKLSNFLVANTAEMQAYLKVRGVDNTRQDLGGWLFQAQAPKGGEVKSQIFVRYSAAIYNRWDYDTKTGRYLKFSDKENDFSNSNEVYAPAMDKLTGTQVAVENVVVLFARHNYITYTPEMIDIPMDKSGRGYVARDGQLYRVDWTRSSASSLPTLTLQDGTPFPLKPGQTWVEVIGEASGVNRGATNTRFIFDLP